MKSKISLDSKVNKIEKLSKKLDKKIKAYDKMNKLL